jgi:hypothetical protein
MINANQRQVVQTANVNLVALRQAEINYFATFFNNFGTQAALMSSFIINAISQVPGFDATCNEFWLYWFWITGSIAFIAAMHMLLTCVYVSIYGQGLALRGPVGSMVRAVEGMVQEQEQILVVFVITIVFISFNLCGVFFVMMDYEGAILCTLILLLAMMIWYTFALRIYNRFKFSRETEDMRFNTPGSEQSLEYKLKSTGDIISDPTLKPSLTTTAATATPSATAASNRGDTSSKEVATGSSKAFEYSGYITVDTGKTMFSDPWKRRYMAVQRSNIFYYKDKKSFEEKPDDPINRRPIRLEGFQLNIVSQEPPYELSLSTVDEEDDRKLISFRCDTLSEVSYWIDSLQKAIQQADTYHTTSVSETFSTKGSTVNGPTSAPKGVKFSP